MPRWTQRLSNHPFAVETRVGERRTEAGLENRITARYQTGEPIEELAARPEIHPDTGLSALITERLVSWPATMRLSVQPMRSDARSHACRLDCYSRGAGTQRRVSERGRVERWRRWRSSARLSMPLAISF